MSNPIVLLTVKNVGKRSELRFTGIIRTVLVKVIKQIAMLIALGELQQFDRCISMAGHARSFRPVRSLELMRKSMKFQVTFDFKVVLRVGTDYL